MVRATSKVVPKRFIGTKSLTIFSVPGDKMSVLISPGAIAFTRTPSEPYSCANSRVKAAKAALDAAKQKYDEVSKELPSGVSGGRMLQVNVAAFDKEKASGRNYFAGTDKNGNYYPLATQEGNMCAVTVITKEDLTFATIFVGTK